ncbi:MAG TPA: hypothetical protein VGB37_08400 [Candidatus Lokiarchaeia archaeon]
MSDQQDRIQELRIENKKLKQQVEDFEKRVLNLVGNVTIESSGEGENKEFLNEALLDLIHNTSSDQLNIVTPKIDSFYATELKLVANRGIPVLLITKDRHLLTDKDAKKIYDDLKGTAGISIINNPNVRYLLIFNTEKAVYSGGSMDKEELSQSVLIVTIIKETTSLRKIAEIFSTMLPSFMR